MLCICFPVWRELKPYLTFFSQNTIIFFVYAFPFEGNWNPNNNDLHFHLRLTLYMVSRLKGIETCDGSARLLSGPALYMVSRLKGIETYYFRSHIQIFGVNFVYAFPFEGNWNWLDDRLHSDNAQDFVYGFPFEGNWNPVLSWLLSFVIAFVYGFPFEGNWNAFLVTRPICCIINFVYAFPFEGNWNAGQYERSVPNAPHLCICFPVWRELKHTVFPEIDDVIVFVYGFPFEGNWNFSSRNASLSNSAFVYAFPFEGNWNSLVKVAERVESVQELCICFPVWRELKLTRVIVWRTRIIRSFGYAFPFEGNWNAQ